MPTTTTPHRAHEAPRALRWTARVLTVGAAAIVTAAVVVVVVMPRLIHGQAMTVLSGSMTPGIPVGSIVLVRPVDPGDLKVGDIATYQAVPGKPVYVTHRVLAIKTVGGQAQFTFKGDANRVPDAKPVVAGQIRGEMWFHVPYLGGIRDELGSGLGKVSILVVLLGGYAFSQLREGIRERSQRADDPQREGADRVLA